MFELVQVPAAYLEESQALEAAKGPLEELWALAHKVTPDSDPVRAEGINRGILDHQPFNKDAQLRLAKALVAQERLSEATEAWECAVSISPRSGEARQLQRSSEPLTDACRLPPNSKRSKRHLGQPNPIRLPNSPMPRLSAFEELCS